MSTLKSRAHEIFQKPPCEENQYFSFDETSGCVIAYAGGCRTQEAADSLNLAIMDCDKSIKEHLGADCFHGQKGVPLYLGIRMALGWC